MLSLQQNFDSFDEDNLAEMIFLESATGKWLDVHGEQYGIPRKLDELDEAYRQRIVYEGLGEITVPFLVNVYGLTLYCYIEDFDVTENTLTSDNVYACHNYMSFVDENTQAILDKKYVIGSGLNYIEEEG